MATTSDIVVPLIAGLFGGAGGAYLTARHSARHDEKTRMLDAADDFSTTATKTLQVVASVGLQASKLEDTNERFNSSDASLSAGMLAEMNRANIAVNEAHAKLARVILLFGDDSWPARFGQELLLTLRAYLEGLEDWPDLDEAAAGDLFEDAHIAHQDFNRASYGEISSVLAAPSHSALRLQTWGIDPACRYCRRAR